LDAQHRTNARGRGVTLGRADLRKPTAQGHEYLGNYDMRTRPLSNRSSIGAALTAAAFAFATVTAHPTIAAAQETEVSPHGKGIVGGALLGAEAVTIVESIAGVHSGVAYGVGALLGAAGGGVGGYFVEQNSSDGRAPVYMLAVGMGLVIPAIVLSLNGMRYQPNPAASEDRAPKNSPPADPGTAGGATVAAPPAAAPMMAPVAAPPPAAAPATPAAAPPAAAPAGGGGKPPALSLFDMNGGSMRLGVPVPEVRQLYSLSELRQYGMAQQTEVRMPLVKIAF
jgi:hypothetical protein